MSRVEIQQVFDCPIEKVWNKVCDLDDVSWRSDVATLEVTQAHQQFIEYTKDGFATHFTIIACEPYEHYAFTMENQNMQGEWHGYFKSQGSQTIITFIEEVKAKKLVMKPLVKGYLKKQQKQYMADLKKTLQP